MVHVYSGLKLWQVQSSAGDAGGSGVGNGEDELLKGEWKVRLLDKLCKVKEVLWIRIFYWLICLECEQGAYTLTHAPVFTDNVTIDSVSSSATPSTGAPSLSVFSEASSVGSS